MSTRWQLRGFRPCPAQIVQPTSSRANEDVKPKQQREQIELLEKSHFHKRQPPLADYAVDPNATLAKASLEKETARRLLRTGRATRVYSSRQTRAIVKTLPNQFTRGGCAA